MVNAYDFIHELIRRGGIDRADFKRQALFWLNIYF